MRPPAYSPAYMFPDASTAMLRASLNMPGPMPSEPNLSVSLAKPLSPLTPEPLVVGLRLGIAGGLVTERDLLPLSADISAPLAAMTAITTPMTGTRTINRIHFETFAAASPVPLKSMLIIWAGRPCSSSGTESELPQYEQRAVRLAP